MNRSRRNEEIVKMYKEGVSVEEIADMFFLSKWSIYSICRNEKRPTKAQQARDYLMEHPNADPYRLMQRLGICYRYALMIMKGE